MTQGNPSDHGRGPRPSSSSDRPAVWPELASTVLRALETISKASPVPGLAQAAGLALQVNETVRKVNTNKAGYSQLADDASELVYVIYCTYRDIGREEDVDSVLRVNLDEVLKVLLDVREVANRGASRGKFSAFFRPGVDSGEIKEWRKRLQQCLNKFGFESDVTIRLLVIKMASQNERMMELLGRQEGGESGGSGATQETTNATPMHGASTNEMPPPPPTKSVGNTGNTSTNTITFGNNVNFSSASGIAMGSNNIINQ